MHHMYINRKVLNSYNAVDVSTPAQVWRYYKESMRDSFFVVTVIPPSLPFDPGSSLSL